MPGLVHVFLKRSQNLVHFVVECGEFLLRGNGGREWRNRSGGKGSGHPRTVRRPLFLLFEKVFDGDADAELEAVRIEVGRRQDRLSKEDPKRVNFMLKRVTMVVENCAGSE